MDTLRIYTLGDLRLELERRPVTDLVPLKGRALVAYLAVAGAAVERSRLAGLLWSDLPESSARANLRLTLTKLRPCVPHLRADRTAVWLDQPWWLDVAAVEELAGGDGDPAVVPSLVRGEFLDGMELTGAELFNEWAAAQRPRIRSTVLAALDATAGRAVTAGDNRTGVAASRRILELDACNEQAHRWLMRLFAAAGQPSAALAQFDTCMHVLFEELGERPTDETAALADEIRSGVTAGPDTTAPALPHPQTSFVGRRAELEHLRTLFDDPACRLITLLGPGGSGKTRVALELVAGRRAAGGQAAFVSFAGIAPAAGRVSELAVTTLAAGLGISPVVGRDLLDVLIERLVHRDRLLVVDNLEHLTDVGEVLGRVLAGADRVRMLATSRRRLGLGAEWVVPLAGMDVPPPGATGDLLRYDAVRLFVGRAAAAGASEPLDLPSVAAVCRALDGMPLAIELAARRVMTVPLPEIRRRLGDELDLLRGAVDADRRHRSMRAALDWSWQLLEPAVARGFARVSVFPSGFTAAAAEAVAGVGLVHLSELVEQSLLRIRDDGRYGMHQLVRQYATDRLMGDPGEAEELAARHAAWIADRMADAQPDALDALDLDDVRAATAWMLRHAGDEQLAPFVRHLAELYRHRSYWSELRTIVETALRRPDLPGSTRAEWLGVVAQAHRNVGKVADAIRVGHRSLEVLGRAVPDSGPSRLRWAVGNAANLVGHRLGLHRSARRRHVAHVVAQRLLSLGELYYVGEQFERLPAMTAGVVAEGRISADRATVAAADGFVAVVTTAAGRHGIARRYLDRAVEGASGGDIAPSEAADTLLTAMVVSLGLGNWDTVVDLATRTVERSRRAALHRTEELALLVEAIAHYHTGVNDTAMALADDVGDRAGRRGATSSLLWAHILWAESGLRTGRIDEAADRARRGLELADRMEQRIDRVRAMVALARVALMRHRPDDAERLVHEAARELVDRPAFASYVVEAYTGVPEVALDLIATGHGDRRPLEDVARRGLAMARTYARAVPIAVPRLYLIRGRLALGEDRNRSARRLFQRALRAAQGLGMPWEIAEAQRHLARDAPPSVGSHPTK